MDIDITLQNYRCFQKPTRITLRKGFTGFIGLNNAGKSSILRFFFELRPIFQQYQNNLPSLLDGSRNGFSSPPYVFDHEDIFCTNNNQDIKIQIAFQCSTPENKYVPVKIKISIDRAVPAWQSHIYVDGVKYEKGGKGIDIHVKENIINLAGIGAVSFTDITEMWSDLANVLYIGAQRNLINSNSRDDYYYDIKIGESFVEEWKRLQAGTRRKERDLIYKLTDDIKNIFEYDDLVITASDKIFLANVNGKSFKFSELGTGITQFILVLGNAAFKQPSYILIDEPELSLHPSLQLVFLTAITSYSKKGALFATHNFGLAQACAEHLYTIHKDDDGMSEITKYEETPRLSELLGELSYSGYKNLGFNKVLLVEGSSELKVIQQFLRLYGKAHKIVLLHLGGNNLIHGTADIQLQEITKIAPKNVYALIDSEKTSKDEPLPNDRKQFYELCQKADIECHILERRATENYFSERAIKRAVKPELKSLGAFEAHNKKTHWDKRINWRIAHEMTIDDLAGTDLAKFLESL